MLSRSRSHLADQVLLRTLADVVTKDRATTAELLVLVSEVDRRRPHITAENGEQLLAAAVGMTKTQVELLIAERFPKADVATTLTPISSTEAVRAPQPESAPRQPTADPPADERQRPAHEFPSVTTLTRVSAPERVTPENSMPIAAPVVPLMPQRRVAPLSPGRFELRLTISQELHDKIKRAEELLGHVIPSGDIPQLLERALDELIEKQEKLQLAATDKPRRPRGSKNPRYVPAVVKRAVRVRDRGQCTFASDRGTRCGARKFLQYDHVIPVARGGASTVDNVRLRCRAHNQLEAERTFGAGFMEEKRQGVSAGSAC